MTNPFEPFALPHLSLKNRIVRSATHDYVENPDSTVSEAQMRIYEGLSQNEVGMIITGHICVHPDGRASRLQNEISSDAFLPSLRELTSRVHRYGSVLIAQLGHAGAKACTGNRMAPSPITLLDGLPAREMTEDDIRRVREQFIEAAVRAQKAGFDGVQLHMAHHYLLSLFVTPSFNLRKDAYGGTPENRFRLALEIIQGIKARCGGDFPVFVKLNANVPIGDEGYEKELLDDLICCRELSVEAAELSGFDFSSRRHERTYYLSRAARLRKRAGLPVILVGGVRSTLDLKRVFDAGIDLAAMSRPLICEEDLIPRMKAGQVTARCLSCNQCFSLPEREGVRCVFHPKTEK